MAKVRSLIKIEGTLDDLTFYKGKEGDYLVKRKGGISASRMKTDPAFARTRENGAEFANSATSGKLLRQGISPLLIDAKDSGVTGRLTQVMSKVKNTDTTSPRGQRNVATGLTTPDGRLALKGFDFNKSAILNSILFSNYTLATATGEIIIADFTPNQDLSTPEGATHVSLTSGFLNLDFVSGEKDLTLSPPINLPINGTTATVTLTPSAVPIGTGNTCYFLKVVFFQEVNNIQYPLINGSYNALQLIEVL